MKKILLLSLLAIFALAINVNAQGFHIIPKVGLNLSSLSDIKGSSLAGLNAGISAELKFTKRFAIEPGVMFSMQGAKTGNLITRLNYINVPIYAKMYIIGGLNVFAGPQLGMKIFAKKGENSLGDRVRTADFGVGLGVGYQTKIGLMVSANYNFGFVNIHQSSKTRNGIFQLNVGWRLF